MFIYLIVSAGLWTLFTFALAHRMVVKPDPTTFGKSFDIVGLLCQAAMASSAIVLALKS